MFTVPGLVLGVRNPARGDRRAAVTCKVVGPVGTETAWPQEQACPGRRRGENVPG